jgi:hypothetical protein
MAKANPELTTFLLSMLSLGSFDLMTDQSKSWRQHEGPGRAWGADDVEQDDCDREDDDPAEEALAESDQPG